MSNQPGPDQKLHPEAEQPVFHADATKRNMACSSTMQPETQTEHCTEIAHLICQMQCLKRDKPNDND